jgi:hypothetical protein
MRLEILRCAERSDGPETDDEIANLEACKISTLAIILPSSLSAIIYSAT